MKKTMITAAVALSLSPIAGFAADVKTSGFIDTIYVLSDGTTPAGGTSQREMRFFTDAELDFEMKAGSKADARVDVDFTDAGGSNTAQVEQAYIAYEVDKSLGLKVGVMNNPFGWEAQDAPGMYQITAGQISEFWDNQTSRYANNVQGVLVNYDTGASGVTIIGGILNDLNYTAEEISMLIGVEVSPMKGLDIKGGLVTADDTAANESGNIINVNATWKNKQLLVGGEVILPSQFVDQGISATVNYQINKDFSITGRYDTINYEAAATETSNSITFAALYTLNKNIGLNAEFRSTDDASGVTSEGDGGILRVEMLGTF